MNIAEIKQEVIDSLIAIAQTIPKEEYDPYSIFIYEEATQNRKGYDWRDGYIYNRYMLHSITPNAECLVTNPVTKIVEMRELSEVNLECLCSLLTLLTA